MDENVPPRKPQKSKYPSKTIQEGGRCYWCGYELQGLPDRGKCPECGKLYSTTSASFLQPSPGAFIICLRLGWPFLGLLLFSIPVTSFGGGDLPDIVGFLALIVTVTINSYYQVRSMLKKHLPEQKRSQGFIFGLRALGTTIVVLVLFVTLLPLIMCGACLFIVGW